VVDGVERARADRTASEVPRIQTTTRDPHELDCRFETWLSETAGVAARALDAIVMRSKGVQVSEPNDPVRDVDWIQALIHTYTIAPTTDWLAA